MLVKYKKFRSNGSNNFWVGGINLPNGVPTEIPEGTPILKTLAFKTLIQVGLLEVVEQKKTPARRKTASKVENGSNS